MTNMAKTSDEFFGDMLKILREKSGLSVSEGSEPALRLMALAAQLEALRHEAGFIYRQSFPQTADGDALDMHAELRGISRRPATCAAGMVRFFTDGEADVTVPVGTVCLSPSLARYATTSELVIKAGDTSGDTSATAVEPGDGGNVGPGGIAAMALAPIGVSGCTNPSAFTGGAPAEDDDTLRTRVVSSYRTLPNGANAAFYQAEAMSVDGVAAARAIPRPRGAGTVDVCVAAPSGVPSAELLAAVLERLESKREIAVDLMVVPPRTAAVAVTAKIAPADGYTYQQAADSVTAALLSYFNGSLLAKPVYMSALVKLMLDADGVKNVVLTAPTADLTAQNDLLPIAGPIALSGLV